MAEQYQVVGPLAAFTVSDHEGHGQKVTFYRGSMVPQNASQAEIDHNLSVRLIAPVGSPEEAIPAMTGPLGTESKRPPEGNSLADPVDRVMAPAAVSPAVATEEQVQSGTAAAMQQAEPSSTDADAEQKRAEASAKLDEIGGTPDGRSSDAVMVEYLVRNGYERAEVEKANRTELKNLVASVK